MEDVLFRAWAHIKWKKTQFTVTVTITVTPRSDSRVVRHEKQVGTTSPTRNLVAKTLATEATIEAFTDHSTRLKARNDQHKLIFLKKIGQTTDISF